MRRATSLILALQVAMLLGCQAAAPPRVAPSKGQGTGSLGATAPDRRPDPGVVSNNGGALVSDRGAGLVQGALGGVVSNQGGRLFGTLRGPATLLSDRGSSLTGAGAARRLLQAASVAQVPAADVPVQLLDAVGQPVLDAAGKPLVTRTDAAGGFRFEGALPDRNLIVSASLAADRGALLAVATRDSRAAALEVDLFSTLTTAYIVNRFVASQADRQQTLDRLPGEVARETRQRAEAAFRETGAAVPVRLDEGAAVTSVEAMRRGASAFDQQMDVVRTLLIVAGQANRGEGRLATTVTLGDYVQGLSEGVDGALYFQDTTPGVGRNRLGRVRADGVLETVIGGGTVPGDEADGRLGTEVSTFIGESCFDAAGRLVVRLDRTVYRVEADGVLRRLVTLPTPLHVSLVGVRADDYLLLDMAYAKASTGQLEVTLLRYKPGAEPVRVATVASRPGHQHLSLGAFVPGRGVLVETRDGLEGGLPSLHWLDPDTGAVSAWPLPPEATSAWADRAGNLLYVAGADPKRLYALPRGASPPLTLDAWAQDLAWPALMSRDGRSVMVQTGPLGERVVRVSAAGVTPVAGVSTEAVASGGAGDLALSHPIGLALGADGDAWIVDAVLGGGRLVRVDAEGQTHGVPLDLPAFWARAAGYLENSLRPLPGGAVALLVGEEPGGSREVHVVRKDGSTSRLYEAPAGYAIGDFATHADGTLHVVLVSHDAPHRLVERAPDGRVTTVFEGVRRWEEGPNEKGNPVKGYRQDPDMRECNVIAAAGGGCWLYGQGRIARWTPAEGFTTRHTAPYLNRPTRGGWGWSGVAEGPDGALYHVPNEPEVGSWDEVLRWDPETGAEAIVAGRRGRVFNGAGVDQALDMPSCPAFNPAGDMVFIDGGTRQVLRVPRDQLQGVPVGTPAPRPMGP
ncbi:MAG: hypothetical protein VKS61_15195 [Candidatus Sericytochromatia bacterium]|nr:hypothetical protein [Candidatus Sericytochromatia bacterium]